MNAINRRLIAVLAIVVVGLGGCASSADREAMVAGNLQLAKQHDRSVSVKVAGGNETTAMESSNISDPDMKAAIEASIVQNKVFNTVVQSNGADYDLMVTMVRLDKPSFGLTFTVELEAAWVLVKQSDRSVVFRQSIKSDSTATFGDSAAAVVRLRLAVEGAARKNIEAGLKAIAGLTL